MKRYLIYSDVHFSKNSSIIRTIGDKYTKRLENCIQSVSWAEKYADDNNINEIICLGDFFDKPDLSSEELTALQEINWSNKPHTFIVGNHDASRKDLIFNSVNSLRNLQFKIIEKPTVENIFNFNLLYIPYLQDDIRSSIKDYKKEFNLNDNKLIVFSHNDVHCQYGMYKNESGFEITDIENNCYLFLNGHIHNNYKFCKNGFNVGNLTGQNFNENAFEYKHYIYVLSLEDTGEISIETIENPYAFNFYQIEINNENDFNILNKLKLNSILSIKCNPNLIENLKLKIREIPNIIESRIICNKSLEGEKKDISLTSLHKINHIDELEKFVINQLGDTKDIRLELNKIRNN